jgi:hypothetical protein
MKKKTVSIILRAIRTHHQVFSQYIPSETWYPSLCLQCHNTDDHNFPLHNFLEAYFRANFYKTFLVPDFHYLPGQHPGFGPFALFPTAQWLDTAAYMGYPWPEYFRRPTTTELCKLPSTCASSLIKSK